METILLGAVLCALIFLIVMLYQLQKALGDREELQQQQAREDADRLRDSLDQKVTLSMSVVSDRLAMVNRSLGSMQSLAQGVGDLKKVLTNVKNRGIWGEMQLGNLLGDMLAPEQYGTNVAIRPPQPGTGGIRHPAAGTHRGCPGVAAHRCQIPPGRLSASGPGPGRTGTGTPRPWL
jgi:hypothetical protein